MGGDYYDREVVNVSNSDFSAATNKVVGVLNSLHPDLNPKLYTKDSTSQLKCEKQHPIVFALDVTGSMGDWSKVYRCINLDYL
jgi:hypothetical protein